MTGRGRGLKLALCRESDSKVLTPSRGGGGVSQHEKLPMPAIFSADGDKGIETVSDAVTPDSGESESGGKLRKTLNNDGGASDEDGRGHSARPRKPSSIYGCPVARSGASSPVMKDTPFLEEELFPPSGGSSPVTLSNWNGLAD